MGNAPVVLGSHTTAQLDALVTPRPGDNHILMVAGVPGSVAHASNITMFAVIASATEVLAAAVSTFPIQGRGRTADVALKIWCLSSGRH